MNENDKGVLVRKEMGVAVTINIKHKKCKYNLVAHA